VRLKLNHHELASEIKKTTKLADYQLQLDIVVDDAFARKWVEWSKQNGGKGPDLFTTLSLLLEHEGYTVVKAPSGNSVTYDHL
jgi:hypothetical protein